MNDLLEKARASVAAMTQEERAAMWAAQRESWARGEAAIGTDRDEALERAKLRLGDALDRARRP